MAIYYFNVSVISRSGGRSATASAAYRAAEKIKDNRTGEIHDYRQKKGVDEKFILAPDSAPEWVHNRAKLWNEVERVERRKDSQVAREIKLAIPAELNRSQQLELVKEFATDEFVSKGMVADVSLHDLSSHNPHAHIMLTMREIDEEGFNKKKNRDWNKRELLEKQRVDWSSYANLALEKAGIKEKIDHRTLAEQGINRIPQIHLGSAVTAMMKRGVATDKGAQWLAIEKANRQIESLERSLTAVEKEISAEIATQTITKSQKASSTAENPYRTKYLEKALLVRQELGNNISDERLELEIYLRIAPEAERVKVLGESDFARLLKKEKPQMTSHYLKAIASVAGTYKDLSDRKTDNLDKWAKKLVNSHLAKFHVQENNLETNLSSQQTKRRGRRM
ncbi:MAG: MobQ family relaxase [Xenococcaceae cyanobacterium]